MNIEINVKYEKEDTTNDKLIDIINDLFSFYKKYEKLKYKGCEIVLNRDYSELKD
jgi:hypothetical protein